MTYAGRMDADPVWHCPLRTTPGDRVRTNSESADIAADLMLHRTGIVPPCEEALVGGSRSARRGEHPRGAVLACQDGARAHVFRDYPRVRAACLAAQQKYGLTVTACGGPAR